MPRKKVKKAVIPAAGLGTRFLPATKALPKEMLPIVDKPTIQYIVEEAVLSGIEEILIITNANKHSMENHFDRSYELEHRLHVSGKLEEEKLISDIASLANIYYVRQKSPMGLGHAVYCARSFIDDEPFAVLLGDDVVINTGGGEALSQLISAYNYTGSSVIGVQEIEPNQVSKYGIVAPSSALSQRMAKLEDMVEKPDPKDAPSNLAVLGRYVLTPEIFSVLDKLEPGKGGEIQLTDAIKTLMNSQSVYCYDFIGKRYDVGDRFGFIQATIDFALMRDDLRGEMGEYIKKLAAEL